MHLYSFIKNLLTLVMHHVQCWALWGEGAVGEGPCPQGAHSVGGSCGEDVTTIWVWDTASQQSGILSVQPSVLI